MRGFMSDLWRFMFYSEVPLGRNGGVDEERLVVVSVIDEVVADLDLWAKAEVRGDVVPELGLLTSAMRHPTWWIWLMGHINHPQKSYRGYKNRLHPVHPTHPEYICKEQNLDMSSAFIHSTGGSLQKSGSYLWKLRGTYFSKIASCSL